MKDGEPLLRQSLEPGSGLKLEAVSIGDSGTYSCMAASEAGEARRHFQLTVMGGCLVLGSLSGWRVRWDSGAEKKPAGQKEFPGGLGSPLCEAPERDFVGPACRATVAE